MIITHYKYVNIKFNILGSFENHNNRPLIIYTVAVAIFIPFGFYIMQIKVITFPFVQIIYMYLKYLRGN